MPGFRREHGQDTDNFAQSRRSLAVGFAEGAIVVHAAEESAPLLVNPMLVPKRQENFEDRDFKLLYLSGLSILVEAELNSEIDRASSKNRLSVGRA